MKLFSWNVNGLRAVLKKNFNDFVSECGPDVLCLQETKISLPDAEKLELPFKYKFFNCAERKGYSGTAILSNVEPLSTEIKDFDGHPHEGRIIRADFGSFNLVNVYVPNSKSELERLDYRCGEFDAEFRKYLSSLAEKKPLAVCGDFNVAHEEIDLARPDDNHMSAGFTDAERESFSKHLAEVPLVDVYRSLNPEGRNKYTWWSYRGGARARNVGWRIDYFLCTPNLMKDVSGFEILDNIEGSDHCPVALYLK